MNGSGDFTFLPREGVWAMAQEKARDLLVIEWHLQNIAIQALVRSRPVAMSVRSKTIFTRSFEFSLMCAATVVGNSGLLRARTGDASAQPNKEAGNASEGPR